jgi:hypothetical protein
MDLEVLFISTTTPITGVSTNFAFVFNAQSIQFVEPIGNGITVPSNGIMFFGHSNLFFLFFRNINITLLLFFLFSLKNNKIINEN